MSILLITGLPGAGKTLRALVEADKLSKDGRQVYSANVRGLKREDWLPCDPKKWVDLPDGSVVFVDEVQDFFPQRGPRDPVPEGVQRLDKHRHRGFTFIFTCQYPKQIDFALRGFVDQHIHLRRTFGMPMSVSMELNRCIDIDDKGDINKSIKGNFKFPKDVYGWYESATIHTMKPRIPGRVLAFPVLVLGVLGLAWMGYRMVSGFGDKVGGLTSSGQLHPLGQKLPAGGVPGAGGGQSVLMTGGKRDGVEFASFTAFQPRVQGLAFTAPRYDEVAKPVRAPYPAACMSNASSGCKCYTQQGTPYAASESFCRQVVAHGFFLDFEPDPGRRDVQGARPGAAERSLASSGGVGSGMSHFALPEPVQTVKSAFGARERAGGS